MVKTDEHMERIRQKLLDETAAIKASEAAKKQRELKKFWQKGAGGKLQERIRNKKQLNERMLVSSANTAMSTMMRTSLI